MSRNDLAVLLQPSTMSTWAAVLKSLKCPGDEARLAVIGDVLQANALRSVADLPRAPCPKSWKRSHELLPPELLFFQKLSGLGKRSAPAEPQESCALVAVARLLEGWHLGAGCS